MKPWKTTILPITSDNNRLVAFEYQTKEGKTNDEIEEIADKLKKKFSKSKKEFKMIISQFYSESLGWVSGKMTGFNSNVNFYNFQEEYEDYTGKPLQDEFKNFIITVESYKPSGGCGMYNDCLWYVLRDVYRIDYMPNIINKQYKLKRVTHTERFDPIHYEQVIKLQDRIKLNINISGDVDYISDRKYERKCNLKLSDGHYTLKAVKSNKLIKSNTSEEKQIVVFRRGVSSTMCYDGIGEYPMNEDEFIHSRMNPHKSMYIFRSVEKYKKNGIYIWYELEEYYNLICNQADELKRETKGLINLYRTRSDKKTAFQLYHNLSKGIEDPEEMDCPYECKWIEYSMMGGLIYAEKGKYENVYSYDINSMYPSVMIKDHTQFPFQKGVFKFLQDLPTDYFPYGLYRVRIQGEHKLFRKNKSNYYTHYCLTTAKQLGLTMELIKDGKPNALIYSKEGRKSGRSCFKPFVDYLYNLKSRNVPRAKKILNVLWGGFFEKDRKLYNFAKCQSCDYNNHELCHIEPSEDTYKIEIEDKYKRFYTNYARMCPFITGKARRVMYQHLAKYSDDVKRIHTDGFISTTKADFKLNNAIGGWKLENSGHVVIINSNKCIWDNA